MRLIQVEYCAHNVFSTLQNLALSVKIRLQMYVTFLQRLVNLGPEVHNNYEEVLCLNQACSCSIGIVRALHGGKFPNCVGCGFSSHQGWSSGMDIAGPLARPQVIEHVFMEIESYRKRHFPAEQ